MKLIWINSSFCVRADMIGTVRVLHNESGYYYAVYNRDDQLMARSAYSFQEKEVLRESIYSLIEDINDALS
jgi:hypothetical protein